MKQQRTVEWSKTTNSMATVYAKIMEYFKILTCQNKNKMWVVDFLTTQFITNVLVYSQYSHFLLFPINHHLYADDTRLFLSFLPTHFDSSTGHLHNAIYRSNKWLQIFLHWTPLKLNFCSLVSVNNLPKSTTLHLTPLTLLETSASYSMITSLVESKYQTPQSNCNRNHLCFFSKHMMSLARKKKFRKIFARQVSFF